MRWNLIYIHTLAVARRNIKYIIVEKIYNLKIVEKKKQTKYHTHLAVRIILSTRAILLLLLLLFQEYIYSMFRELTQRVPNGNRKCTVTWLFVIYQWDFVAAEYICIESRALCESVCVCVKTRPKQNKNRISPLTTYLFIFYTQLKNCLNFYLKKNCKIYKNKAEPGRLYALLRPRKASPLVTVAVNWLLGIAPSAFAYISLYVCKRVLRFLSVRIIYSLCYTIQKALYIYDDVRVHALINSPRGVCCALAACCPPISTCRSRSTHGSLVFSLPFFFIVVVIIKTSLLASLFF